MQAEDRYRQLMLCGPLFRHPHAISSCASFASLIPSKNIPNYDSFFFLLEFKRKRFTIAVGSSEADLDSWAIIPAERGYMAGLAVLSVRWNSDSASFTDFQTSYPSGVVHVDAASFPRTPVMPLLRFMGPEESEEFLRYQSKRERAALRASRVTVRHLGLPMDIVDCEIQFDGERITFFFESSNPIQFNSLTRDLFRLFHTRVWLENVSLKRNSPL